MSRGGYLNLESEGNYSPTSQTLTVYVIAEEGENDYGSIYADPDFAALNADRNTADGGVPCQVLELTLVVAERRVVYSTKP